MRTLTAFLILSMFLPAIFISAQSTPPVTPNASKEAKALLEFVNSLSGKYTLTGQHNYPNTKDRNTQFAAKYTGQTPAIWSTDMGFAEDGNSDSYLARPDIVKEAIRQHKKGSIITICWHAVPPTADEPVTFQPRGKVAPDSLASIQGQLTDGQFKDVLTPGTRLYSKWAKQVDSIAVYLKKLQEAGVPVLWRPYHEMNGDWFWWGGRVGEYSTADLYRQLFDRYVNYHKLNNLVWVWNVDRPSTPIRKFSNFYPGTEYLDIVSLDVYGSDFNQAYYDSLLVLSKGKPMLFGEVGNPPSPEILNTQPNWTSWVIWAGMVRNTTKKQYQVLLNDPRILSQEDAAYWKMTAPYRKACGLLPLPLVSKYPLDFTGEWKFNEEKSNTGNSGAANVANRMIINQEEDVLSLKKVYISEWDKDRETEEEIRLDGVEMKSMVRNSPRISKAGWEEKPASLKINSTLTFKRGENTVEMKSSEAWSLNKEGNELTIFQKSDDFRGGERELTLVYVREGN
jgi:mannan endo-1,4-beta-mannosidase